MSWTDESEMGTRLHTGQAAGAGAGGFGLKGSNVRRAVIKARAWRERQRAKNEPTDLRALLIWSGWRMPMATRVHRQLQAEDAAALTQVNE